MLVAEAVEAPSFNITSILQFGLLGLIFICILFRKFIVPEWTLSAAEKHAATTKTDLVARVDELKAQVNLLQTAYQDLIIPALIRATEINVTYLDELQRTRVGREE